jgi:hypothetical protein
VFRDRLLLSDLGLNNGLPTAPDPRRGAPAPSSPLALLPPLLTDRSDPAVVGLGNLTQVAEPERKPVEAVWSIYVPMVAIAEDSSTTVGAPALAFDAPAAMLAVGGADGGGARTSGSAEQDGMVTVALAQASGTNAAAEGEPPVDDEPIPDEVAESDDPHVAACQIANRALNPSTTCRLEKARADGGLAFEACMRDIAMRVRSCIGARSS